MRSLLRSASLGFASLRTSALTFNLFGSIFSGLLRKSHLATFMRRDSLCRTCNEVLRFVIPQPLVLAGHDLVIFGRVVGPRIGGPGDPGSPLIRPICFF